ncbi:sigma-70 family RNA polymerase sigma factor [Ornithinibacillus massiliensis]|nr:sigma-70 family RNA polymerase sigma factor [Ornithinibacillus massiliensis]
MSMFKSEKQKNREQLFETLIKQEQKKLYRVAYSYVKNEQTALDIVQDTVIKAYKSFDRLKNIDFFSTWITRILINTALDHIKKSKDIIPLDVGWLNTQIVEENLTVLVMDIEEVFGKLKANQKTLLLLRFYYGYSIPEIADILEKPEGTVKSQLHRTLQIVKKKLAHGGDVYGEAAR